MELRLLPSLNDDRGNAIEPVQARLDFIGRHLPSLVWAHGVGRQAVANDGKAGEGHAMRFDLRRGRQLGLHARQRGVHILQRLEHVDVPVEEEVDFGRSAAGDGTDILQSRHTIHGFFEWPRDGDHHLIDGHHAVIDPDQDSRKIRGGKNRNRDGEGEISADQCERHGQKDDGPRMAREPVGRIAVSGGHLLFVPLARILRRWLFTCCGLVASFISASLSFVSTETLLLSGRP